MALNTDEVTFLRAHLSEVEDALHAIGPMSKRTQMQAAQDLRARFGTFGRAVMELGVARSSHKLPEGWLMDQDAAQQATHPLVAMRRAQRIAAAFPQARVADVTCSIGAELAALQACGLGAVGADIDLARLKMAAHNVPSAHLLQADALAPAMRAEVMIADPARRSGGKRIWKPEELLPPLPALLDTWRNTPVAIKCAPGLNYSFWDAGISVVSVDGAVKELCLYSSDLLEGREAVVMRSDGHVDVIHSQLDDPLEVSEPQRYIIDPDGAIVRAGLVRHYAHREQLAMLDEHIAYLTGPRIPEGASGFPYIETVALKQLKKALQAHDCGALEILVRGVDVDPDQLRKKLKLKGSRPMTVVIARIGSGARAYICGRRAQSAVA